MGMVETHREKIGGIRVRARFVLKQSCLLGSWSAELWSALGRRARRSLSGLRPRGLEPLAARRWLVGAWSVSLGRGRQLECYAAVVILFLGGGEIEIGHSDSAGMTRG